MRMRMILPTIFGLAGFAVLMALGIWQMQRLAWKESVLAEMRAAMTAAPVALPDGPDAAAHNYLPVRASGRIGEGAIRILGSRRLVGPGYRLISAFETGGRRILLDRGFVAQARGDAPLPVQDDVTVAGNLHWPDEIDASFTPEPDLDANIWFARDVPAMARHLGTEPVLLVARDETGDTGPATPWPVDMSGIANDHLEYAITWFSLSVLWLGMTLYLLWRIRQRTV
ncbi:SURF1 family protein [Maritimibacter sp. 55A14]|uniref:SURF1 family protein n=1 Tax=Maritimibacter sp. 55A14 TaxID=2174844 RepID=UPI000D6153F2|nr:SURF1 family protein [Maritimibacter sp. 55A14]PWE33325.1 SURF1 family protein [Maritimibacter sp. 55A14]